MKITGITVIVLFISCLFQMALLIWRMIWVVRRGYAFSTMYEAVFSKIRNKSVVIGQAEHLNLLFTDAGRTECSVTPELAQARLLAAKAYVSMLKVMGVFGATMVLMFVLVAMMGTR